MAGAKPQAQAAALVALMRWPWMAECPCTHENTVFARITLHADTVFARISLLAGWREGTFQKVYNISYTFCPVK